MKPYFEVNHVAGVLLQIVTNARRPVPRLRRAAQAPRPAHLVTRTITGTGLAAPSMHNSPAGTAAGLLPMAVTSYYRRQRC
jgi:hypothetical protein